MDELIFWGLFLFFNFSLFAFNYFINMKGSSFSPFSTMMQQGDRGILMSNNPDFFRFSVDISLIIFLFRYKIFQSGFFAAGLYYGFVFLYNMYHYSFKKIYQVTPAIVNDARLIKNGLGLLWGESKFRVVIFSVGTALLIATLIYFFDWYLNFASALILNTLFIGISGLWLSVFFISAIIKGIHSEMYDSMFRFLVVPMRVFINIKTSLKLSRERKKFDPKTFEKYRLLDFTLRKKPNIYFLFLESYGSILLREPKIRDKYLKETEQVFESLNSSGWFSTSNLSRSVSLIGPSWLSYTSVLLGKEVNSNFHYEYLLHNDKFYPYDTLTKVFQKCGYVSYNLNASKPKKGVNTPLDAMKSLYGIDTWILRENIAYSGMRYGFTEGPPDQYVLNYAYEEIIRRNTQPFVLFYITKNSHTPFISPAKPMSNWRDLDDGQNGLEGNRFLQIPTLEDYFRSIQYQLHFLKDFIQNNGQDDDLYFLIGDHQPHALSNLEKYGLETLVHVIAKDRKFLQGFENYGFGKDLDNMTNPTRHEALFSIFMREIIRNYGTDYDKLPEYEPMGLQL